jgi:hypothetical protein
MDRIADSVMSRAQERHARRARKRARNAATYDEIKKQVDGCTCWERLHDMTFDIRGLVFCQRLHTLAMDNNCPMHGLINLEVRHTDADGPMLIEERVNHHTLCATVMHW